MLPQMLLRTGLQKSKRAPDEKYNYGYRRELFVWSLISGVGIFCLGSGVSIVHGLHHIFHPAPLEYLWASMTVLAVSAVVESYSLAVAYRSLAEGARAKGMSVKECALLDTRQLPLSFKFPFPALPICPRPHGPRMLLNVHRPVV